MGNGDTVEVTYPSHTGSLDRGGTWTQANHWTIFPLYICCLSLWLTSGMRKLRNIPNAVVNGAAIVFSLTVSGGECFTTNLNISWCRSDSAIKLENINQHVLIFGEGSVLLHLTKKTVSFKSFFPSPQQPCAALCWLDFLPLSDTGSWGCWPHLDLSQCQKVVCSKSSKTLISSWFIR